MAGKRFHYNQSDNKNRTVNDNATERRDANAEGFNAPRQARGEESERAQNFVRNRKAVSDDDRRSRKDNAAANGESGKANADGGRQEFSRGNPQRQRGRGQGFKQAQKQQQQTAAAARYPADKLAIAVAELGLSEATYGLLSKNNVRCAGDIVGRTEREMYKIQGLNKKILAEIRNALKNKGMSLKDERSADESGKDTSARGERDRKNARDNDRGLQRQDRNAQRNGFGADAAKRADRTKKAAKEAPERPKKLTEPLSVEDWRKVQKNGKWGFFDGFKTVIPAMYDEVFRFKEGLASVEIDEKCGYIDSENNIVIPFEYETAMSFSEGFASVVKGGKCGYINRENEVVIPFEYDAATPFEEGEAKVKKDGRWGTLTPDGTVKWI